MFGTKWDVTNSQLYLLHDMVEDMFDSVIVRLKSGDFSSLEERRELLEKAAWWAHNLVQFEKEVEQARADKMQFSVEDLYRLYGQYDKFISIDFHKFSEAAKNYGRTVGGIIRYRKGEKATLQQLIDTNDAHPRNHGTVYLDAAGEIYNLTDKQVSALLTEGFSSDAVHLVSSYKDDPVNAYKHEGEKEISNTITVPFHTNGISPFEYELFYLQLRFKTGPALIPAERSRYCGLLLALKPNSEYLKENPDLVVNGIAQTDDVRRTELECKEWHVKLTPDEETQLTELYTRRFNERQELLAMELRNNSNDTIKKFAMRHFKLYQQISAFSLEFDDEVLIPTNTSVTIFWDFASFLHIYLRHFAPLQPDGAFKARTSFQYNFRDIQRLIKIVIESALPEIIERLSAGKDFRKGGEKSLYFNGNYYAIRIEPSGRLDSFSPYHKPGNVDKL